MARSHPSRTNDAAKGTPLTRPICSRTGRPGRDEPPRCDSIAIEIGEDVAGHLALVGVTFFQH
jgi:hypothetical protein